MAKGTTKNKAVEVVDAEAPREMAWLEVHGQEGRSPAEPKLVQQAMRAWAVVKRMDELEEELKAIKEALAQAIGAGRSLVVPRACRVSVAATRAVTVADADKLRALLGERFGDLVTESVSYKPTEKLIEMSADGDDPMAPAYRELLRVRTGTTVRITAEK